VGFEKKMNPYEVQFLVFPQDIQILFAFASEKFKEPLNKN
jgi:hypothetical protein